MDNAATTDIGFEKGKISGENYQSGMPGKNALRNPLRKLEILFENLAVLAQRVHRSNGIIAECLNTMQAVTGRLK